MFNKGSTMKNMLLPREFEYPQDSWVHVAKLVDADPVTHEIVWEASLGRQYRWCVYKALIQMVSTGVSDQSGIPLVGGSCLDNASAYCEAEYWLSISMCYVGFIFQCIFTSQLMSLYVAVSMSKSQFRDELRTANEYMRSKRISLELRVRARGNKAASRA